MLYRIIDTSSEILIHMKGLSQPVKNIEYHF